MSQVSFLQPDKIVLAYLEDAIAIPAIPPNEGTFVVVFAMCLEQ
jgi:hypothetical protein